MRRLLAERSARGRGASYVLAVLAVVAAAWALYAFFPRRPDPTVELRLPLPAGDVEEPAQIHVWPEMPLRVTGEHHTDLSTVELELDGQLLGRAQVDAEGSFRAAVRVPRGLSPGRRAFVCRDRGSGNVTAREEVLVEDASEPGLAMQPETVRAGGRIAVTGGGFPGGIVLTLLLDDEDPTTTRTVGRVRTRPNGLVFARIAVPADVPEGDHRVTAVTRAGRPIGRPGTFELTGG